MFKNKLSLLAVPTLLLSGVFAQGQYQGNSGNFYNGVRDGGRGGNYNNDYYQHQNGYDRGYDDRYNQQHQGGIGPGKGALIGGGGGAVLGALFGGTKGALIGGGAGAGIGALIGKKHQDDVRNRQYDRNGGYYDSNNRYHPR